MGPNIFVPTALVFPAQDGPLHQKDLMPRFGVAYDVFGNGRTAAKFFLGRYVTTANTVDEWVELQSGGVRAFGRTDDEAMERQRSSASAIHDRATSSNCDLLNTAANGECGPMANPIFAQVTLNLLTVDPETTDGWNTREYSWDLNARSRAGSLPESVGRTGLRPADLGKHAGHGQPRADAGGLRFVHLQRAVGSEAAGRRRISADVLRHQAGEVRTVRQLPHVCRRSRRRRPTPSTAST